METILPLRTVLVEEQLQFTLFQAPLEVYCSMLTFCFTEKNGTMRAIGRDLTYGS